MNMVGLMQLVVFLFYFAVIVGIVVTFFKLAGRFVRSHERSSAALELIAQKLGSDNS